MMLSILIGVGLMLAFVLFLTYAMCRVAGDTDRQQERAIREMRSWIVLCPLCDSDHVIRGERQRMGDGDQMLLCDRCGYEWVEDVA